MSRAVLFDQRIVHLPAAEVVARLPRSLAHDGVRLDIAVADDRPGTGGAGARRFRATWHAGRLRGDAHVEVAPLSQTTSVVEVLLPARFGRGPAEALRDELEGRQPPPPRTTVQRPNRPVLRLVVAGVIVALVAVGLPAFGAWTRPQPVTVEPPMFARAACSAGHRAGAGADGPPQSGTICPCLRERGRAGSSQRPRQPGRGEGDADERRTPGRPSAAEGGQGAGVSPVPVLLL